MSGLPAAEFAVELLASVRELCVADQLDDALDAVFDEIDARLSSGDMQGPRSAVAAAAQGDLPLVLWIGFLSVTLAAASHMVAERQALAERIRGAAPDRAASLLRGLI